ncbi:hypothetical protein BBF93_06750 [Hyphomonas sp. CACIAM 19H1]|uniref:caspase family protein n=1 Tax=Hyphomonas sp. CACIAM 19H1 TaxID=1873716 RepID=UPI000DEDC918|nr:caspase family protein [Hyphomonas sp. CACIAM 19H1]AXE63950.1 hypothetical protein BBF93_06750 [Hyphomonas sp. CACIAM 19H1]
MQPLRIERLLMAWLMGFMVSLPLAGPASAQADSSGERWALLVGVSDYQNIGPRLSGPRNDVTLLSATLMDAGFSRHRMRLLADGLEASTVEPKATADGEPTREAILGGLDWLTEVAGPGSEVMIYLSGHGSQAPAATPGDETDGLDELFLPIDAVKASAGEPSALNAITDNELGVKLRALRNRGAKVWLIVDACHSGTLSRAGETVRTARFVDPESLGIARGMGRARPLGSGPESGSAADGVFNFGAADNFVGFYAALPSQLAYESKAPGAEGSIVGEFTWSLLTAIRAGGASDYEELGRQIVSTYAQGMRSETFAMFEGDLHKSPMIGSGPGRKSFAIRSAGGELFVKAGALDGLGEGTVIALNDRAGDTRMLARARLSVTGLSEARLEILETAAAGEAIIASAKAGGRAELARLAAVVIAQDPSFVLHVAGPATLPGRTASPGDRDLVAKVTGLMDGLLDMAPENRKVAIQRAGPDEPADIYPYISDGRVWFFRRGADLALRGTGDPYSLDAASLTMGNLEGALRQFGKHANLMRVAGTLRTSEISAALDVRLFVLPGSAEARQGAPCPSLDGPGNAPEQIGGPPPGAREYKWRESPPVVRNCDYVYLDVRNTGSVPLDVSTFYIDAWGNVFFLWTYAGGYEGDGMRVHPGESRIVYYPESLANADHRQATGPMQLLVLAVPGSPGTSRPIGFRHLEAQGLSVRSADHPASELGELLERAGFGDGHTRSAGAIRTSANGGALVIPVVTQAN